MIEKNCPNEEDLSLYATGDLCGDARIALEEHLEVCRDCRQTVASIERTLNALPRLDLELSDNETSAFVQQVAASLPRRKGFFNLQTVGAAATTIAAGLAAVFVFSPDHIAPRTGSTTTIVATDIDLVEQLEMIEHMELLEELELLELLDDRG
ncbi:MAG: hypothetical protein C0623_01675 [Desulfuromonas sp.]|nr:MAG: hypothetical protein C0623_01675 [Desulfuromonas sp.]